MSSTGHLSSPAAVPEPIPDLRGAFGEPAASLAALVEADRIALVSLDPAGPQILARHPADGAMPIPAGLVEAIRGDESVRIDESNATTLLRAVAGVGGARGALVASFVAGRAAGAEERLGRVAPIAGALLDAAVLADRAAVAEDELKRMRGRMRELTRTVSSGIASVDREGRVQEMNSIAAEIIGVTPEEAIGRDFRGFIAPEDVPAALETFRNRLLGYLSREEAELHVIRPTGERRLVQVSSSPLIEGSEIVGVYFAARDITDERAREIQIRRAERLASLGPLLGGVCHELNNPLTSIKSFAELMLLDDRPAEDVEALEIVRREAARAARIVSDLKLVARQTQEDGELGLVRLNDLVMNVVSTLGDEARAAGAEVRIDLAQDLPQVSGSAAQIERLIVQLVTNAIQVLEEHEGERTVEIATSPCDAGVRLRVRDTGPGIEQEHVERIFDPFWTTRTTGGTGLGLSLVHSIVSDHKGRISVDGGRGSGATFTVELPAGEPPPAPVVEPSVQAPARLPLRILVVDDEGPIRYTMVRYMSRRGHTVVEAEEGGRALDLLAEDPNFDIILADLRMPGLGGEQLFTRLRELGAGMEERLIFITGDAQSPDAARVLEEAGVPVVLKPFELAEIAQIIEAQAAALA